MIDTTLGEAYSKPCFFDRRFDTCPGTTWTSSGVTCLLADCRLLLTDRLVLCYYTFSGCPHIFSSHSIHVIHFRCHLFTLRHMCNILFRNPQLTCCQRSIFNIDWYKILVGLVRFYGISTIVDYLTPNPLYTYIKYIYDMLTHFVDYILKRVWALFCAVKWFQVLLYNSHNLISVSCLNT